MHLPASIQKQKQQHHHVSNKGGGMEGQNTTPPGIVTPQQTSDPKDASLLDHSLL